tara:strand:+ start:66 stop:452 length:387 start_codon:yes stop_codon:yes gene_type:complete
MDIIKYRKMYLSENWGINQFVMVRKSVGSGRTPHGHSSWTNHPFVSTGQAFWINDSELCVGYKMNTDPDVFRPIFSHKRQRLLDRVHSTIVNPSNFWNRVKWRYYFTLCHIKTLPLECADYIVEFMYR